MLQERRLDYIASSLRAPQREKAPLPGLPPVRGAAPPAAAPRSARLRAVEPPAQAARARKTATPRPDSQVPTMLFGDAPKLPALAVAKPVAAPPAAAPTAPAHAKTPKTAENSESSKSSKKPLPPAAQAVSPAPSAPAKPLGPALMRLETLEELLGIVPRRRGRLFRALAFTAKLIVSVCFLASVVGGLVILASLAYTAVPAPQWVLALATVTGLSVLCASALSIRWLALRHWAAVIPSMVIALALALGLTWALRLGLPVGLAEWTAALPALPPAAEFASIANAASHGAAGLFSGSWHAAIWIAEAAVLGYFAARLVRRLGEP